MLSSCHFLVALLTMLIFLILFPQLLRRMFHIQVDAFGAADNRCYLTSKKIEMLQKMDSSGSGGDSNSNPSGAAKNKDDDKLKRSSSVLKLFKSLTKKKSPG
jgi:hypothetical protein